MNELDPEYNALIESNRVSAKTRATLRGRLDSAGEPAEKDGLAREAVRTLQTIAECVAPLTGRSIDFGAHINARLATGEGKGWRYAELPPDLAAYRAGIKTIDRFCLNTFDVSFNDLQIEEQIQTLTLIERGELVTILFEFDSDASILDAAQMQRWFEDLRGDVTALYMSHPETLAQLGYSGIADGADSTAMSGFVELGLGKVEPWEPKARGTSR
jgi:hypothetical protein